MVWADGASVYYGGTSGTEAAGQPLSSVTLMVNLQVLEHAGWWQCSVTHVAPSV